MRCSFGNASSIRCTTVRPPTPESKMPIAGSRAVIIEPPGAPSSTREARAERLLAGRRRAEDAFPDLRRLHAEVERYARQRVLDERPDAAVHRDPERLEVAPLAVGARHLLAGEEQRAGKALPNLGAET